MYRGINSVILDAKGRMVMPTKYRMQLQNDTGAKVVVTIDTEDKCLLLYPLPVWEEIEKKIEALPSFNPITRRIQRLLIGHASEQEFDSNGRVLLPPLLREYAGLEKEVILVGQGKKFEIWSLAAWNSGREGWLAEGLGLSGALPPELQSLSL
jgi:MraZ protein